MQEPSESAALKIEEKLTDEQREKIGAIDNLEMGAYPKAMCVLVALEMKPATEISLALWNSSPEEVKRVLEAAGLKVFQKPLAPNENLTAALIVAKEEAIIEEMKTLSAEKDHRRYGELMGFTNSMIDAFEIKSQRLPNEERPREPAAKIFWVVLSRDHLQDEMKLLRQWAAGLKKYAPKAYQELLGSE